METNEIGLYTIVWHFDGTTLTSTYETEEIRDKAFEEIAKNLNEGVVYHKQKNTILNASQVLCITKGDLEEWTSQHAN